MWLESYSTYSLFWLASFTNQYAFKENYGFNHFIWSDVAAEDLSHQNFNGGKNSMRFAVQIEAGIGGYSRETWKLRLNGSLLAEQKEIERMTN